MSNGRVILSAGIAKRLILRGHVLADLKPKKENPMQTVFVFFADRFLNADIDNIMANKSNDTAALSERLEKLNLTESEYKKSIFDEYLTTI